MEASFFLKVCEVPAARITVAVFDSMLRMDLMPANAAWPPTYPVVTAEVRYSGAWQGSLSITTAVAQADKIAGRLVPISAAVPANPMKLSADVLDAFSELANMIGGNVKVLLPGKVQLSTPNVRQGILDSKGSDTKSAFRLAFAAGSRTPLDSPFWLSMGEG
jgi:Chemotaxis phosphatase CheX